MESLIAGRGGNLAWVPLLFSSVCYVSTVTRYKQIRGFGTRMKWMKLIHLYVGTMSFGYQFCSSKGETEQSICQARQIACRTLAQWHIHPPPGVSHVQSAKKIACSIFRREQNGGTRAIPRPWPAVLMMRLSARGGLRKFNQEMTLNPFHELIQCLPGPAIRMVLQ